jgi:hypothetical protein
MELHCSQYAKRADEVESIKQVINVITADSRSAEWICRRSGACGILSKGEGAKGGNDDSREAHGGLCKLSREHKRMTMQVSVRPSPCWSIIEINIHRILYITLPAKAKIKSPKRASVSFVRQLPSPCTHLGVLLSMKLRYAFHHPGYTRYRPWCRAAERHRLATTSWPCRT